MKHFLDIQVARIEDDEFKSNNVGAFYKGDVVQISEKVDGSNASICWDTEKDKLVACSRKQELSFSNTLNGFWNYAEFFSGNVKDWFKNHSNMVIFGEWNLCCNKIKDYKDQFKKIWIVYDIYNKETQKYMPQTYVREVAKLLGFEYIHVLYEGPFLDWDHVKTFLHACTYGDTQEGVVIKNQTRLEDAESHQPAYLKIVNESFKERMKTRVKKEKSADELEEEARVQALVDSVVTPARVEKGLYKLRDEGILPKKIDPKDMKLVAQNLPKYIYQDILKEEREIVESGGELFGKYCGNAVMKIARQIILS